MKKNVKITTGGTATMQIRAVPVALRQAFQLAALQRGATMRQAIIDLMAEYLRASKK